MKIVLAGGSGFLGRALSEHLVGRQHTVVILSRSGHVPRSTGTRVVSWEPDGSTGPGVWAKEIDGADAIVNLAGAGIADRRWTRGRKALLRESRVLATRSLVAAVRAATTRPSVFVQGSGAGFYGAAGDGIIDESFPPGRGFLGDLAVAWEAEAHPVAALGCRLALIRTGIVLARDGGALQKMMPPTQNPLHHCRRVNQRHQRHPPGTARTRVLRQRKRRTRRRDPVRSTGYMRDQQGRSQELRSAGMADVAVSAISADVETRVCVSGQRGRYRPPTPARPAPTPDTPPGPQSGSRPR